MAAGAREAREGGVVEEVARLLEKRIKDPETLKLAVELFRRFYEEGAHSARRFVRDLVERTMRGDGSDAQDKAS